MRNTKLVIAALGLLMSVGTVGCKNPKAKKNRRTVQASIAEFDPNADFVLDMNKTFGSDSPDEYAIEQAFGSAFEPMDVCVLNAKKKMGVKETATLNGSVEIAVQLDPTTGTPAGVNATLPKKYAKNKALHTCIREAVGGVKFPTYDGTPRVAEFSCELDAGAEYEEEW